MLNLIKGELFKTRKSRITYVTIGIMGLLAVFMFGMYLYGTLAGWKSQFEGTNGFVMYSSSFDMDMVYIVIALFAGTMVTNEYIYGSIRQIVSRGFSRKKIIFSQYLSIGLTLSVILVASAFVFGVIASCFFGVGEINWLRGLITTLGFCGMAFGYGGFSMFLAYIIKSGGICLGVNTCIILGGGIGAEVLYYMTKNEMFVKYWLSNLRRSIADYTSPIESQIQAVAVFFAIGIVFMIATMILFQKRDVD